MDQDERRPQQPEAEIADVELLPEQRKHGEDDLTVKVVEQVEKGQYREDFPLPGGEAGPLEPQPATCRRALYSNLGCVSGRLCHSARPGPHLPGVRCCTSSQPFYAERGSYVEPSRQRVAAHRARLRQVVPLRGIQSGGNPKWALGRVQFIRSEEPRWGQGERPSWRATCQRKARC